MVKSHKIMFYDMFGFDWILIKNDEQFMVNLIIYFSFFLKIKEKITRALKKSIFPTKKED
jgi:hypothetical protein